jgi:hypothetical protein
MEKETHGNAVKQKICPTAASDLDAVHSIAPSLHPV